MVRANATKHQDGMVSHSMSHEPGIAHARGDAEDHVHPGGRRQLLLA